MRNSHLLLTLLSLDRVLGEKIQKNQIFFEKAKVMSDNLTEIKKRRSSREGRVP